MTRTTLPEFPPIPPLIYDVTDCYKDHWELKIAEAIKEFEPRRMMVVLDIRALGELKACR